jgi:hypothetical protein
MLWTGELVFVTTSGNIYTLAASDVADYVKNPDPNLTRQCASLTFVVALPKVQGTTYSGLGIGFQSNVRH